MEPNTQPTIRKLEGDLIAKSTLNNSPINKNKAQDTQSRPFVILDLDFLVNKYQKETGLYLGYNDEGLMPKQEMVNIFKKLYNAKNLNPILLVKTNNPSYYNLFESESKIEKRNAIAEYAKRIGAEVWLEYPLILN